MATNKQKTERRTDALSKDRIVDAAIEILDSEGEGAWLFRSLTTRLSTGVGAIYHHVANKGELMAAAADSVIAGATEEAERDSDPRQAIRTLALGLFEAIDAHPWVGTQLAREPWQPAVRRIWEGIGRQLHALGLTATARSDAGSALVHFILGSAAQYAAGPRSLPAGTDRKTYLDTLAKEWILQSSDPLARETAASLSDHDDRAQFLAGVDIFLAGIGAGR